MTALRSPFAAGFGPAAANDLAATIGALASPQRLRILNLLAAGGQWTSVDIEKALGDIAQPTVAHHLRVLDKAGLIASRKESAYTLRTLAPGRLRDLAALITPGGAS